MQNSHCDHRNLDSVKIMHEITITTVNDASKTNKAPRQRTFNTNVKLKCFAKLLLESHSPTTFPQ
jgi:hypothetical protein